MKKVIILSTAVVLGLGSAAIANTPKAGNSGVNLGSTASVTGHTNGLHDNAAAESGQPTSLPSQGTDHSPAVGDPND